MAVKVTTQLNQWLTQYEASGKIVIPILWLNEMLGLNNLVVTESLDDLRMSKRLSDRVFYDVILDGVSKVWKFDGNIFYAFDLNRKSWEAIPTSDKVTVDDLRKRQFRFCINGEQKAIFYQVSPYFANPEIPGIGRVEYRYNKLLCDYFCGKFPVKLKQMCPRAGDESLFTTAGISITDGTPKSDGTSKSSVSRYDAGMHIK